MRHPGAFCYRIRNLPPVPLVLQFIAEQAHLDQAEAYGSLNMGAGFALFVETREIEKTVAIAERNGIKAYHAGAVEAGPKRVVIEPLDIIYEGESLHLRL